MPGDSALLREERVVHTVSDKVHVAMVRGAVIEEVLRRNHHAVGVRHAVAVHFGHQA